MSVAAVSATPREVLLIDLSAIFRAAFHAAADQPLSVAFQATLDGVRRCMNGRNALVAICCDGKGNWRKKLDPLYKAHREKQPASMYDQLDRVKERLRADGLILYECEGFEADDIVATLVDGAVGAGHPVTIASHDKDLLQLLQHEGVSFLKTSTWETLASPDLSAKFGVQPNQWRDFLAITGDTSDGVPGVAGFGPKTAAELLNAYGSIDGIYDAMAKGTFDLKGKKLETWNASIERLDLSRKLVTLRYDAPIDFAEIYQERKPTPLAKEIPAMPEAVDADFDDAPQISKPPGQPAKETPAVATAAKPTTAPAAQPVAQPSVALVTADARPIPPATPVSFELALEPQSPGQAVNLSARLHNARLYTWLTNEDQVLAVIMRGREVGLSAGAALDTFKPVEGHLCPSAHYIIDRAKKDIDCEYFYCVETTATSSTWETKNRRNPKATRLTYTIEQAKMTGLVKEDKKLGNWMARPAEMLRKTCGVQLARMEYPGSATGLYAIEELGGEE